MTLTALAFLAAGAFAGCSGNLTGIEKLLATGLGSDETEEVFIGDYNQDGLTDIFAYDFGRVTVYY